MFNYMIGTALLRAIFGDVVNTETFQRRLGLVSFVLISLFATVAGYYQSHSIASELAQLAADGVSGQGAVVDKAQTWRNNNAYYDFVVEHVTSDHIRHRRSLSADKAEYDATPIGRSVPILYLGSAPDTFYLVGHEPKATEVEMFTYILRGGLVALAISSTALVLMWSGGGKGGAPAPPSAPPSPVPTRPAPRLGPDGRPTFGKRG